MNIIHFDTYPNVNHTDPEAACVERVSQGQQAQGCVVVHRTAQLPLTHPHQALQLREYCEKCKYIYPIYKNYIKKKIGSNAELIHIIKKNYNLLVFFFASS